MLTKDGAVKLADFGVSTKLSMSVNKGEEKEDAPMGTPFYSIMYPFLLIL